jgi:hypothetical protein
MAALGGVVRPERALGGAVGPERALGKVVVPEQAGSATTQAAAVLAAGR